MLKKTVYLLFISACLILSACSDSSKEEPPVDKSTYIIELEKFNIVLNGDYHDRSRAKANTQGINKALIYAKENGYKWVRFPKGFYPIMADWGFSGNPLLGSDTLGIIAQSNLNLDLRDATFRLLPNQCYSYSMFLIYHVENVEIVGGHVIGDRYEHVNIPNPQHPGSRTYEWGYGFCVVSSKNITIRGAHVEQMTGDAVAISRFPYTPKEFPNNENVKVTECKLHDCRRQGLTLTKGRNTEISYNDIYDIKNGTLPMCGIDIEELTLSGQAEDCLYTKIHHNRFWDFALGAIACNTGDYVEIYENELDNWIWVTGSKGVKVYKNTFTNTNGNWIYTKFENHLQKYDNYFPGK